MNHTAAAVIVIFVVVALVFLFLCSCGSGHSSHNGRDNCGFETKADCLEAGFDCQKTALTDFVLTIETGGTGSAPITDLGYLPILSTCVKTCCECSKLAIVVSAMTSIIHSATGLGPAPNAELAMIDVKVTVDGKAVCPSPMVFNRTAYLNVAGPGSVTPLSPLVKLDSMLTGNSFTFNTGKLCEGKHQVVAYARLRANPFALSLGAPLSTVQASVGGRDLLVLPLVEDKKKHKKSCCC